MSRTTAAHDAVSVLYAEHYLALVRLARHLVDDLDSAEDVVQEVFAALAGKTPPDDPDRHLRRAVVNRSRSMLRRRSTARTHVHLLDRPENADPPDADLLADERTRRVLAAIDGLPRRQREVVVLRYYEDLSVAEIAAVVGIRAGAVSTALHKALTTLSARIEDDRHEY